MDVSAFYMYNAVVNRFIFIFFSLIILLFSCSFESRPVAEGGVLDLSAWDFSTNKKIGLAGEWEFYWDELLHPDESGLINNTKELQYIEVPSNWRYYCLFNGIQYHAHGQATYRLKLLMSSPPENLVLYSPHILLSFRIFINRTEIVSDPGIIPSTGELNLEQRYFNYYPLTTDQSTFFITIQVQNPEKFGTPVSGGILKDIFIGQKNALAADTYSRTVQESIYAGACFIMFFYHLIIFLKNRKNKVNFFLSLICLTMGIMVAFFTVDFIVFQTINFYSRTYYDLEKLFFLLEYIVLVLVIQYIRHLYNDHISSSSDRMFIGFTFICFLLAGFILLLPPFPGLILVKVMLLVLISGYLVIKSFKIFFLQKDYSVLGFSMSFIVFYFSVLTDIIVSIFSLNVTFSRISYPGFIILLIINTYYLSVRSGKILKDTGDVNPDLILGEKDEECIKELTITNKKLKEQDAAKTSFFVNASYELRTPLTVIRLSVDEILQKSSGHVIQGDHPVFSRIQRQCDKLLRYVNNILDFSSLELNIKEVQMRNFDLKAIITFFVSEMTSMAQSRTLTLAFTDNIEEKAVVLLDFRLFETAFFNVISNAFKYTPAGGEIGINLEKKTGEQAVELSITDTGIGIPGENLKAIFSWYSKVNGNENKKKEGMGIGLAVTRKIIELHGGSIKVTSGIGTGSTFTIILPCTGGKDSVELNYLLYPLRKELLSVLTYVPYPEQNTPDSRLDSIQTILIIDDEPDLLGFLNEVLAFEYTILTANNGVEGITLLKKEKPDLIITDIMMPEMDGYEFVREVRRDNSFHDIPVLFLTAKSGTEEKIKGLSTGVIDYICKPFTIDELRLKIKNIMQFQIAQKDRLKKRIVDALYKKDKSRQIDYTFILQKYIFTPREEEVFYCLARGLSNKEIAITLHVSEATVKRSVSGVYKKMGVTNRLEFSNKLNKELNR